MANIQGLLDKMTSVDKDLRYMACSDLIPELQKAEVRFNERVEMKVQTFLTNLVVLLLTLFSCAPIVSYCCSHHSLWSRSLSCLKM